MRFMEFGDKGNPAIVLIHAFGGSWKMWLPHIEILRKHYLVIVPVLDGHDHELNNSFISVSKSALDIIKYIEGHHQSEVLGLCGVSLGGLIAVDILAQGRIMVRKAIIDGAPVLPVSRTYRATMGVSFRLISFISRLGINMFRKVVSSKELADDLFSSWRRISTESIKNVSASGLCYTLPDSFKKTTADVSYWYGEKEAFLCKRMAVAVSKAVPTVRVEEMKGFNHSEFCILRPDLYAKKVMENFGTA